MTQQDPPRELDSALASAFDSALDAELIQRSQAGDQDAFAKLVAPQLTRLKSYALRIVGHPDDAADIVQDCLERAYRGLSGFRQESRFSTWLIRIATNLAIDYLRKRPRFKTDAQLRLKERSHQSPEMFAAQTSTWTAPDFTYDIREHISYCFTCVARSLSPEQQVVLVLRDVMDYTNGEAAQIMGMNKQALRHKLRAARNQMMDKYDHLCALVNKQGVCYQCHALRDQAASKGPDLPHIGDPTDTPEGKLKARLAIVRNTDLETGTSWSLHELLLRQIVAQEQGRDSRDRSMDVPSQLSERDD